VIRAAFWAGLPALAAAAYYLLAWYAALRWPAARTTPPQTLPALSLLKPMYGASPGLYDALRSHAGQEYPQFEILFGFSNPRDSALEQVEKLRREFPNVPMEVVRVATEAPNPKAFVLSQLARRARHSLLVINDDDIVVEPGYFRSIVAPLSDPKVGLVTCLYRVHADSRPGRFEALGVATEFVPSVLVARLLGVVEFALGATMAVRGEALAAAGGLEPISAYLADDYQLGLRVTKAGYRVEFAPPIVETNIGAPTWAEVWRHQLRWSRTIRVSRPAGYYGSIITNATLWALVAFAAGQWWAGGAALTLRLITGGLTAARVLRAPQMSRWLWLMPLRDLFGLAVWIGGCFGSIVYWRGRKLRLAADGRITA
jgi:ceramide glucosyltransferase